MLIAVPGGRPQSRMRMPMGAFYALVRCRSMNRMAAPSILAFSLASLVKLELTVKYPVVVC